MKKSQVKKYVYKQMSIDGPMNNAMHFRCIELSIMIAVISICMFIIYNGYVNMMERIDQIEEYYYNTTNTVEYIIIDKDSKGPISVNIELFEPSNLSEDKFAEIIELQCEKYNYDANNFLPYHGVDALVLAEEIYGINSVMLLGIFRAESGLVTHEDHIATNNLASIMYYDKTEERQRLKVYESIDEHILDLAERLTSIYRDEWGLSTIHEVGLTYCPPNPEWANVVISYTEDFNNYI